MKYCEIIMEERGHFLHVGQPGQVVEGKASEGVDDLVSGKPIRGIPA
jgi:hypothetical protein